MPVTATVSDWGEAMMTSLAAAFAMFFAAIPKILAFAIILAVGWFLATLVQKIVAKVLRSIRFNDLAQRAGFAGFVQRMGIRTDSAGFIGEVVKWFVRLIAMVVAFDALGLPAVSDVLRQLLLWLPNLVVALVVLVIGGIAANALSHLVEGATSTAGFSNPGLVAKVARVAVWAFAIVVAVNQIGIAETLVNTLFMAVVGAAALAFGLAFGLGGRDTAAEIWRRSYSASKEAAPKLQRAGEAAAAQASQAVDAANEHGERRRPGGSVDIDPTSATPLAPPFGRRSSDRRGGPAYGDD